MRNQALNSYFNTQHSTPNIQHSTQMTCYKGNPLAASVTNVEMKGSMFHNPFIVLSA